MWFRNDLRLKHNPAFHAAATSDLPVLCLYILENGRTDFRAMGAASKWWADKSIASLDRALKDRGGSLHLRSSSSEDDTYAIFKDLTNAFDVQNVFWNRRYAKYDRDFDASVKSELKDLGVNVCTFNGNLLMEPWQVTTKDDQPYKVFTPFWKSLKGQFEPNHPQRTPDCELVNHKGEALESWKLHPTSPDWSDGLEDAWTPGEDGAMNRLSSFLDGEISGYPTERDRPDLRSTSRLSPYLAFGEISPHQIWRSTQAAMETGKVSDTDGWAFLREVGWRDFSYSLIFQADALHRNNWNDRFDGFEWGRNESAQTAWQKGQTGYPIVDAGMRELWQSGWMHNRVRMIVASFLIKHLMIDWREGEEWFWDTLVDADCANNPASWQWVAGSGADAAPYFRIFNPITQGQKFDPNGDYVRKWIPEIGNLPTRYLHAPWEASGAVLKDAGITLGKTYPKPIVEHKRARERALEAYEATKAS